MEINGRREKAWSVVAPLPGDEDKAGSLVEKLGITPVLADLLVRRGLGDSSAARRFLNPEYKSLSKPETIPGMQLAVERIARAVQLQERVMIYGDYDADGVCSTALLKECLDPLLPVVDYYIPNRFTEGYGLNSDSIREIHSRGYQLIITVDCGIASVGEVELAHQLGMEVIVTDHHQVPKVLPNAAAVVNPKLDPDCDELAGVGVVFQLARALARRFPVIEPEKWLDIVALATVADIVPLIGDNRVLVREGMKHLRGEPLRPGMQALIKSSGLNNQDLQYWHLGFVLAPRLNAAGRMEDAGIAVELLLTGDETEARLKAEKLVVLNTVRQGMESDILKEAQVEAQLRLQQGDRILLLAKEGWHQGVLGIVASRLVEQFGKPVLMVAWDGPQGKGSGRTAPGFDLFQALNESREYLEKFGGHQQAVGIVVNRSQLEGLRQALNETAACRQEPPEERLIIDRQVELGDITPQLISEIRLLEPYGPGNSPPVFVARSVEVLQVREMGRNKEHLKLFLRHREKQVEAVGFGMADGSNLPFATRLFDVVFEPTVNIFRGQERLQLRLIDLKASDAPDDQRLSCPHPSPPNRVEELETFLVDRLADGHQVLVVYPTLRCLEKHLPGLRRILPSGLLRPIHGGLSSSQQRRQLKGLISGGRGVFLTTSVFFQYYIKKLDIKSVKAVALWLDESIFQEFQGYWRAIAPQDSRPRLTRSAVPQSSEIGRGRCIIYTNRRKTLHRLLSPGDLVEAGLNEPSDRIRVRLQYMESGKGNIFWDGAFGGAAPRVLTDQLYLADSPFGSYEIDGLLEQINCELPDIRICFSDQALDWNRRYLSSIYPEAETLAALQRGLMGVNGRITMMANGDLLVGGEPVKGNCRDISVRSGLRLLYEMGLCRLEKKGDGIFSVNLLDRDISRVKLKESPYYREGQEEKRCFEEWIRELPRSQEC